MTVSVTLSPAYPVPNREFKVTFAATLGNYVRVVVTSAPTGSAWANHLRDNGLSEAQILHGETDKPLELEFDRPGSYVCKIREYRKGVTSFGGGYADDPDGYKTETWQSDTTYLFVVGQKLTGEIQIGSDRGTLVLYVWDTTIRPTTFALHGEVTPRIDASTDRMRTAVSSSTVVAALAALENAVASTACSDLATIVNNIITKVNAHLTLVGVHNSNDTDNAIASAFQRAGTQEALQKSIGEVARRVRQHVTNDSGSGPGTAGTPYHDGGTGSGQADWANVPLVSAAPNMLQAGIALAAIWHAYESHRTWSFAGTGHDLADTTNTLTALPTLLGLYKAIVAVLATATPTAPATDNPGATVLVHLGGLVRT